MKLIYRGIRYNEKNQNITTSAAVNSKDIVYRGNSLKARINPKFPCLQYIKQLFSLPGTQPTFDPIAFWYDHKRQFLEDLWCFDHTEKLEQSWNLTLQIEQAKALKAKQKTKLKYRGVTYYR
jgi:Domain of unknown function (DUF4278)